MAAPAPEVGSSCMHIAPSRKEGPAKNFLENLSFQNSALWCHFCWCAKWYFKSRKLALQWRRQLSALPRHRARWFTVGRGVGTKLTLREQGEPEVRRAELAGDEFMGRGGIAVSPYAVRTSWRHERRCKLPSRARGRQEFCCISGSSSGEHACIHATQNCV